MPRARKNEDQPWLKYIVLPMLLILFGLETSYIYFSQTKPISSQQPEVPITAILTPTPTPLTSSSPIPTAQYTCPKDSWVNCMPGPDRPRSYQCTQEFLTWAKTNCPNFQGIAY